MQDFTMRLPLKAPADAVYRAIASADGPKHWWTKFCRVEEHEGGIADFLFPDAGFFATMRVTRLEPARLVEWECIDGRHAEDSGFSDLRDWVGTRVRFEIEPDGEDASVLAFTHIGLNERLECNDTCRSTWSIYLGDSLRNYLEKGLGRPYGAESAD
jgi:uncharacterized protein YndB with AHSA1/START domain